LFGHGSGKIIYRDETTGKCPLSIPDPLDTSQMISTCYEKGESYESKFGDISTSYEECRADLSGLYLSNFPEMYKIFGWTD
jgi:dipeptidyl-peptidase-3